MKNRGWIIGAVVMLLAALMVFLFRDKIFRRGTGGGDADAGTSAESNFPLKYGSRGERVKALQAYINKMWGLAPVSCDYMPLAEDGIFGAKTEASCELFLNTKEITEEWYKTHIQ